MGPSDSEPAVISTNSNAAVLAQTTNLTVTGDPVTTRGTTESETAAAAAGLGGSIIGSLGSPDFILQVQDGRPSQVTGGLVASPATINLVTPMLNNNPGPGINNPNLLLGDDNLSDHMSHSQTLSQLGSAISTNTAADPRNFLTSVVEKTFSLGPMARANATLQPHLQGSTSSIQLGAL